MPFIKCVRCEEYYFDFEGHRCGPLFKIIELDNVEDALGWEDRRDEAKIAAWLYDENNHDSWRDAFGHNASETAAKFIERDDNNAGEMGPRSRTVFVFKEGKEPRRIERYEVRVEMIPEYSASSAKIVNKPAESKETEAA